MDNSFWSGYFCLFCGERVEPNVKHQCPSPYIGEYKGEIGSITLEQTDSSNEEIINLLKEIKSLLKEIEIHSRRF